MDSTHTRIIMDGDGFPPFTGCGDRLPRRVTRRLVRSKLGPIITSLIMEKQTSATGSIWQECAVSTEVFEMLSIISRLIHYNTAEHYFVHDWQADALARSQALECAS